MEMPKRLDYDDTLKVLLFQNEMLQQIGQSNSS